MSQLSILMPDAEVDKREVGKQLDMRFRPLVDRLKQGGMKCGLLISNKPLSDMTEDGSNARWAYFPFDGLLSDGDVKPEFNAFMARLAECAADGGGDPISRFFLAQDEQRLAGNRARVGRLFSPSISVTGPSLSMYLAEFAGFFRRSDGVITNLFDRGSPDGTDEPTEPDLSSG